MRNRASPRWHRWGPVVIDAQSNRCRRHHDVHASPQRCATSPHDWSGSRNSHVWSFRRARPRSGPSRETSSPGAANRSAAAPRSLAERADGNEHRDESRCKAESQLADVVSWVDLAQGDGGERCPVRPLRHSARASNRSSPPRRDRRPGKRARSTTRIRATNALQEPLGVCAYGAQRR